MLEDVRCCETCEESGSESGASRLPIMACYSHFDPDTETDAPRVLAVSEVEF